MEEIASTAQSTATPMAAEVVISYASKDREKVMAFVQRLLDLNVHVWIDYGNIDGALLWGQEIVEAIEGSKVLILMASESSVASPNVVKEVTLASENKKHILPLHLEPIAIPKSLKWHLAGIQHIELFSGNDESNFRAIVRSLERLGVKIEATPRETLRPPPSPNNETETTEEHVASKRPEADAPIPILANAESAARDSVTSAGHSPVHDPSAEAMHGSESNKLQTPEPSALSSPIETASAGTAATSDAVTTGQPARANLDSKLAVTPQTQLAKQTAPVAGGGSVNQVGEKAGAVLAALPVAVGRALFAGFLGYTVAAQIVGFVIAWVKDLPHNEYVKLIADLRIYCGLGLMVIVFIATLKEKASKK
jgi:hypothetical protein